MIQSKNNIDTTYKRGDSDLLTAREKRRLSLLDTAEAVFLEKGYDVATINDILRAANLSKGGFYHYFKSKKEVLDALRNRYTNWFIETVEKRVHTVARNQIKKRFQTWIHAYGDAYFATFSVHDLVYHSMHSTRANEDRVAIIKSMRQLLEQGIAQGAWTLSSPQFTATLIYSAIHGVMDDAIVCQDKDYMKIVKDLSASLGLLLQ